MSVLRTVQKLNKRARQRVVFITLCVALTASSGELALGGTFTAFGPEAFERSTGAPVTETRTVTILDPNTHYFIKIHNGSLEDGEFEKVSSSVIALNEVQVLGPEEFNQTVSSIEKPVSLSSSNELTVEVRGKPGGIIVIEIVGIDNENSLAARMSVRAEHVARLNALRDAGRLIIAGPNPAIDSDDPGDAGFTGSIIIAEFDSLQTAQTWADADPYIEVGAYASVSVKPFRKVLP